jgi:hypothetical protein
LLGLIVTNVRGNGDNWVKTGRGVVFHLYYALGPKHITRMRGRVTHGILVVGAVLLGTHDTRLASADEMPLSGNGSANPYSVIVERNVFRLNSPPPIAKPDKTPSNSAEVNVTLSGFMQTGDQWQVLLAVKSLSPDPKAPPLQTFLTLIEGGKESVRQQDQQTWLEVVKIYAEQERVDILNSGVPMTLSMKTNGFANAPHTDAHHLVMTPEMRKAMEIGPARVQPGQQQPAKAEVPAATQPVVPAAATGGVSSNLPPPADQRVSSVGGTLMGGATSR